MKNTGDILYAKPTLNSDERYTPRETVLPIVKYILALEDELRRPIIVWLPFDTKESEYYKVLTEVGINVVTSHIQEGKDFFTFEPAEWDIIVSNPPFKNKKLFFERALALQKPFALLMASTWLNDYAPFKVFGAFKKELQLLTFDKRTRFLNLEGVQQGRPSFSSFYFCCAFLPKQIITETLKT